MLANFQSQSQVPNAEEETVPVVEEPISNETRMLYEYQFEKNFMDKESCDAFINNENCWALLKTKALKGKGIKTTYRCNLTRYRGARCDASIYTIHSKTPDDVTYDLYRRVNDHNHETLNNTAKKLSPEIKEFIGECVNDQLTLKTILHKMRQRGINEPDKDQVKNYIKTYRKKMFGDAKVTIQDMIDFCEMNKMENVEDGLDVPFVLEYEHSSIIDDPIDLATFDEEDEEYYEPWIRFIVSTRRLLSNSAQSKIIHADATQKMIIQRYPVLVFGTTDLDAQQHFHLLGIMVSKYERAEDFAFGFNALNNAIKTVTDTTFKPDFLMADAAGAIHAGAKKSYGENLKILMCYAHVKRNLDREKLNDVKTNKSLIKTDTTKLRLAFDDEIFKRFSELFVEKWNSIEREFTEKFSNSWITRNSNWFNGAAKTNNALENYNGQLKIHHTYYQKKGLAEFKVRMLDIVRKTSMEYIKDKEPYQHYVDMSNRMKKEGLRYSKLKKTFSRRSNDGYTNVYFWSGENPNPVTEQDVNAFLNATHQTFDEFANHMFDMYIVKFDDNPLNWKTSSCSCPAFADVFMCKHILCIAYQLRLLSAKAHEPLQPNTKTGRPAKATPGLVID